MDLGGSGLSRGERGTSVGQELLWGLTAGSAQREPDRQEREAQESTGHPFSHVCETRGV
jgi:hypothetical protein